MNYGYFLTIFIVLNIYSFCYLNENEGKLPISVSILLKQNFLIALKCFQPKYGVWSSKGYNNGDINLKENRYYVRKGLSGDYTISLESSVNKGYFWRVHNSKLNLEYNDGTDLFLKEASFIPVPGLQDYHLLSLRSFQYPRQYVRHFIGKIIASGGSDNGVFLQDATWNVISFDNNLKKIN